MIDILTNISLTAVAVCGSIILFSITTAVVFAVWQFIAGEKSQ